MFNRESGRQLTGFSMIGIVNTVIHLAIVTGLVELLRVYPVLANGLAFLCANLFSFWANSRWSFRLSMTRQRYARFLVVSLFGLMVSLLAVAISEALQWHYLMGVFIAFILLPLITFFAHRNWTWKIQ